MRFTHLFLVLILLLFSGCGGSSDDSSMPEEEIPGMTTERTRFSVPVSLIYSDHGQDMLVSLDTGGEVLETVNLTGELEIPAGNIFIKKRYPNIQYESKDPPGPSFWDYNLSTGLSSSEAPFCPESPGEEPLVLAGSRTYYISVTAAGDFSEAGYDCYVNIYNKASETCQSIALGYAVFSEAMISDDTLILLENTAIRSRLQFVDLLTGTATGSLDLEAEFRDASVLNGQLIAIYKSSYEVRDLQTRSLISTEMVQVPGLNGGEMLAEIPHFQNKALGHFAYPQPGVVGNGPVIYDFDAHEYSAGLNLFLFDVRGTLDANLPGFMGLTGYEVDMEKEEVYVGVSRLEDDGTQAGGLVLTDFDGAILFFAPLDFAPEHIVLHTN